MPDRLYARRTGGLRPTFLIVLGLTMGLVPLTAQGIIVRFDTIFGDIDVRLYNTATPLSVTNFLNYVEDGDYNSTFFHRSDPDFIIQGGGFKWPAVGSPGRVTTDPPVLNEPGISNLRGTIAYAKVGGDPNSATSGWFFNLNDNSGNLDNQNGGFTVFGRVIGDGMDVIDMIEALEVVNFDSTFNELPVLPGFVPGELNRDDVALINTVAELPELVGDYNFDGVVDAADYTVWRDSLGSTLLAEADGNGNGVVDQIDYALWKNNFGATSGGGGLVSGAPVPEPATGLLALALAGIAALLCVYRSGSQAGAEIRV